MRVGNVFQLGIKELRGLQRDRVMLFLLFYCLTVTVYEQATVAPELLNKAPISVVDEDSSPLSERIVDAFYPTRFLPGSMNSSATIVRPCRSRSILPCARSTTQTWIGSGFWQRQA